MATTIDNTWLSGKTFPIPLATPNEVYTLGVDIDINQAGFDGQAFALVGPNVQLNLNGKTIRNLGKALPQTTDSRVGRRESEHTIRPKPSLPVRHFASMYADGNTVKESIPESSALPFPWNQNP